MTELDDIFTKSNLDENKRRAKRLFGRMLINLRKSNKIKLYSLLESVCDTNMVDNVIKLTLNDKSSYDMLNNKNDISTLQETLNTVQSGLEIELLCDGKEEFDMYKFESFLKSEFGKLLTIKKE